MHGVIFSPRMTTFTTPESHFSQCLPENKHVRLNACCFFLFPKLTLTLMLAGESRCRAGASSLELPVGAGASLRY